MWISEISPFYEDSFLGSGRNLLEEMVIFLPFIPLVLVNFFYKPATNPTEVIDWYMFIIVLFNTISWYGIGRWLQWTVKNSLQPPTVEERKNVLWWKRILIIPGLLFFLLILAWITTSYWVW